MKKEMTNLTLEEFHYYVIHDWRRNDIGMAKHFLMYFEDTFLDVLIYIDEQLYAQHLWEDEYERS